MHTTTTTTTATKQGARCPLTVTDTNMISRSTTYILKETQSAKYNDSNQQVAPY
ncbi:hypothetical protein LguiA_026130 [Lonicera macranthoides]